MPIGGDLRELGALETMGGCAGSRTLGTRLRMEASTAVPPHRLFNGRAHLLQPHACFRFAAPVAVLKPRSGPTPAWTGSLELRDALLQLSCRIRVHEPCKQRQNLLPPRPTFGVGGVSHGRRFRELREEIRAPQEYEPCRKQEPRRKHAAAGPTVSQLRHGPQTADE